MRLCVGRTAADALGIRLAPAAAAGPVDGLRMAVFVDVVLLVRPPPAARLVALDMGTLGAPGMVRPLWGALPAPAPALDEAAAPVLRMVVGCAMRDDLGRAMPEGPLVLPEDMVGELVEEEVGELRLGRMGFDLRLMRVGGAICVRRADGAGAGAGGWFSVSVFIRTVSVQWSSAGFDGLKLRTSPRGLVETGLGMWVGTWFLCSTCKLAIRKGGEVTEIAGELSSRATETKTRALQLPL